MTPAEATKAEHDIKAIQRDSSALGVVLGCNVVLLYRRIDLNIIERKSGKSC